MTILDDMPYRYPGGRFLLKEHLAMLADDHVLRRVILDGPATEAENYVWDNLMFSSALPDDASAQIGLTLRSREEATAVQRVRDAFDEVARSIRDKPKDEDWILHPC